MSHRFRISPNLMAGNKRPALQKKPLRTFSN